MRVEPRHSLVASIVVLMCSVSVPNADCQSTAEPDIPANFRLDQQTAARLRPQLLSESVPPSGPYTLGHSVLERLVSQAKPPANLKLRWELRIVQDGQLNAYASPDGTIYVESGLADLVGSSAGLWRPFCRTKSHM